MAETGGKRGFRSLPCQSYFRDATDFKPASRNSAFDGDGAFFVHCTCDPSRTLVRVSENSWVDNAISSLSYIGMSIPSFWLGMVLVIVFTAKLHLLPSSGMNTVGVNTPWDTFLHMIMPCITLSLGNLATFIRYIRSSTIGELGEEYVLTAQAKGTKGSKILFHHVLKNTLLPIITLIGMNLATLVCGSFIIEVCLDGRESAPLQWRRSGNGIIRLSWRMSCFPDSSLLLETLRRICSMHLQIQG